MTPAHSAILHRREDFGGVAFRGDFPPDFAEFPVGADPERRAHNAEERSSEETFHAARAVGFDDFEIRIGEQREIQIIFGLEFCLRFDRIAAATDNRGVRRLTLLERVAKADRFVRSAGRVGLGIKVEDDVLAAVIREGDGAAIVGLHAKAGGPVAFLEHVCSFAGARTIFQRARAAALR